MQTAKMTKIKPILLCGLGFLLLSGCSVFSPVKSEATAEYVIDTVPSVPVKQADEPVSLLVMQPTGTLYGTRNMAYSMRPHQVAYFGKTFWAASPPQMLQTVLMKALQNTHYFAPMSSLSVAGSYKYLLSTQLIKLQQDFTSNPSVIHLIMRAQLTDATTNQVIATKQFIATEAAPENTPYGGVLAANRAAARVVRQITLFCLRNT